MDPSLRAVRDAWIRRVQAEDYDAHMESNGQTAACAAIVEELLAKRPPITPTIWIPGVGPGGLLARLAPSLGSARLTCTDINAGYLERLKDRPGGSVRLLAVAEDIEATAILAWHDTVIVILVLEHVDIDRAIDSLTAARPRQILVITQQNTSGGDALGPHSHPVGTMAVFREAKPRLVARGAVDRALTPRGYFCTARTSRNVAHGKRLAGAVYSAYGPQG